MKLQFVFRKRTSLIAENVLDLAKLLVEGGSPCIGLSLSPWAVHQLVKINEIALCSFCNFNANNERDRNARTILDKESEKVHDEKFTLTKVMPNIVLLRLLH
jgi:hypothetical protein